MLLFILLTGIVAINCYLYLSLHRLRKSIIKLESVKPSSEALPKVSIIVPIHNEENKLKVALQSLCQLDYSNYEIIAVNDRSNDNSIKIIQQLASTENKLKLITIENLPQDWLGKPHALQQGLDASTGELILFTDADVIFDPAIIDKAVTLMLSEQLDHLTLAPYMILKNTIMRLFIPFQLYTMLVSMRPWRANTNNTSEAIGIGAFNLVTKQSMTLIDGFSQLRLNPVDDVGLAKLLKKQGLKQSFANPGKLLCLNWYDSYREACNGLEKNIFAFLDYSYSKTIAIFSVYLIFYYTPVIALFSQNHMITLLSLSNLLLVCGCLAPVYRELELPASYALFYPLTALLPWFIGVRSVFLTWYRAGIYWGGKFFPLKKLKQFHKKTNNSHNKNF